MKTINKIIYLMLLLTTVYANASEYDFSKQKLVDEMSQNENVKLFLSQRLKAVIIGYMIEMSESTPELKKTYELELKEELNASFLTQKNIDIDFAEFANLSVAEKNETYEKVINTPVIYNNIVKGVKCFAAATLGYAVCTWGSLSVIRGKVWGCCFAAAIFTDIVAAVTNPELASGLYGLLRLEARTCWEIATAAAADVGIPSIEGNCATSLTSLFGGCLILT